MKRSSSEVKIAVLCSEFLTAVTLFLDCEWRSVGLVEDLDLAEADLDVSGSHLRVLALSLDNLAGNLDNPLTAEA